MRKLMKSKLFGVFYALFSFFFLMILAFGAEFLVSANIVFFGLVFLSLIFLIFGIIICVKRKINPCSFYFGIIITEIILFVLIIPTGFLEKFILFRDKFHSDWGIIWIVYLIVPAVALFLLAIAAGIIDSFHYLSDSRKNSE